MNRSRYLTRVTNPSVLRTLEPTRRDRLLRPHAPFFAAHGAALNDDPTLLDVGAVTQALLARHDDTPFELVDALTHIDEMATEDGMARLESAVAKAALGLTGDPDRTPADLALEVWLLAPDLLRRQHAEHVILRRRSRHSYLPESGASRIRPSDLTSAIATISERVSDWYRSKGRGDGAAVIPFEDADELRLVIQHGGPYERRGRMLDGRPSTVHFRPLEFASATLNWSRCELSLNSQLKGGPDFLRRLIGECIFGQPGFFADESRYSLQPLRSGPSSLRWSGISGIRSVRLGMLELAKGGVQGRFDIIRADDVFAALEEAGESIPTGADLVSARFIFEFADSGKERSVTLHTGNRARYTRDGDSAIVEAFFVANGFMREVVDAAIVATA